MAWIADGVLRSSASRSALRAALRVTVAPAIRWVAARSGTGPDSVGMVTVTCWAVGRTVRLTTLPATAPCNIRSDTTRARGCAARAGGHGRGRGLGRRDAAPRGASGECCQPGCRTRSAGPCCSPGESTLLCACRTRSQRRPGRRRRRARRETGSGRGSRPISPNSCAAVITLCGPLNTERKTWPSGCSPMAEAIWRSISLIWAPSAVIIATRLSTSRRRVASPRVADATLGRTPELYQQLRGLLGSRVALPGQEPGQARLAQPARVGRTRVAVQERERIRLSRSLNRPSGAGQKRSSSARS